MRTALNLLPPNTKAALRTGFVFASAQSMLVMIFVMAAFAAGTLIAVRMLLLGTYRDLAARSTTDSGEYKALTGEIGSINKHLAKLDGLHKRFTPWSSVLASVTDLVPPGIKLESLRANEKGLITLSGTARDRDDVLLLGQRLENSEDFENVSSPLSNILQQKNLKFDFQMQYGPLSSADEPPAAGAPGGGSEVVPPARP